MLPSCLLAFAPARPDALRGIHFGRGLMLSSALLALWALSAMVGAETPTGGSDPIVFESRADAPGGGGLLLTIDPAGHTFRLLQRTRVTELGARFGSTGNHSVYMALYALGTPDTAPDIVGESRLIATTLVDLTSGVTGDFSGPMDVTLEPGWYSIMTGTGRHGATAPASSATLVNADSPRTPNSLGPYRINATSNERFLQGVTSRLFVRGQVLPPEPLPDSRFLYQTAFPAAWWTQGAVSMTAGRPVGTRFEVTESTRMGKVSAWMRGGTGQVYALIVQISGPGANPPAPTSPAFANALRASTLINVASEPNEYSGHFGDVELTAGHYALMLGAGDYGASGSAWLMGVSDQIIVPGYFFWADSFWGTVGSSLRFALEGVVPELSIAPDPIEFERLVVLQSAVSSVTVSNLRDGPLTLSGLQIIGASADQFALGDGADDCASAELATGGSCSFDVQFSPDSAGLHSATLQVSSDGDPSAYSVELLGEGANQYTVTPLVGTGGNLTPDTPQLVFEGDSLEFTVAADLGYQLDSVGGDCGGTLDDQTYTTAAIVSDCQVLASFVLNPATTLSLLGGADQATVVGESFAEPVQLLVSNPQGLPVPGVEVQFSVPESGASALVVASMVSDAQGELSLAVQANQIAGSYSIAADFDGADSALTVPLSNLPGAPASVTIIRGDQQTTLVGSSFATPLELELSDAFDNSIAATEVSFLAPASGASADLTASQVSTDALGRALVTAVANELSGSFQVTVSITDSALQASFTLTNRDPVVALTVSIDSGQEYVQYGAQIDYLIELDNQGPDAAAGLSIVSTLSSTLDAANASWTCLDSESGCAASGSGDLADAGLNLAAGERVRYLLSADVLSQTALESVSSDVDAFSPDQIELPGDSDSATLVLFRNGFQTTNPAP